jgi:hypothetical protein
MKLNPYGMISFTQDMVLSLKIFYAVLMGVLLEAIQFGGGAYVPLEGGMREISGGFLPTSIMCWGMVHPLIFGKRNG